MDDSDIIIEAKGGNKGAYREMLRKYSNLALAVAYARSGNKDTSRNAAADAFVQASKELSEFPDTAPIAPWIAGISRTAAAKHMEGVRRSALTIEAAKENVQKAVEEAGGAEMLDSQVKNELALSALSALTDEARETLSLRHLYNSSYSNIAAAVAVEASEIDEQIAQAREQLAQILSPLFE